MDALIPSLLGLGIVVGIAFYYANRNQPPLNARPGTPPPPRPMTPVVQGRVLTSQEESLARESERAAEALARVRQQISEETARVEAMYRRLSARIQREGAQADFDAAILQHRASVNVADKAFSSYALARDKKKLITGLIDKYSNGGSPAMVQRLRATRSRLQQEIDRYLNEVRRLNANTHSLKEFIRDNFGRRGRGWYDSKPQNR